MVRPLNIYVIKRIKNPTSNQCALSADEFKILKSIDVAQTDVASQAYRRVLLQRFESFRQKGLKGIANHDRGDGLTVRTGQELRFATLANKVLTRYFPQVYQAWLDYPAAMPVGADEQFFWLHRSVEGRPTAILGHRIMLTSDAGEVMLSRQFYVGHSYNSNQLSIACLIVMAHWFSMPTGALPTKWRVSAVALSIR